jgi:hypothetical protein
MRLVLVGTALLVAACTPAVEAQRSAITHGTVDSSDPAVAALLVRVSACGAPPTIFCSGTLIAPRALLTAAHCLDVAPTGAMVIYFGTDARQPGETHAVIAGVRHPTLDVAVLALDAPATAPPLALDPGPSPAPGDSVRLVGFGVDENGQLGQKRQGTAQLTAVTTSQLQVSPAPALACGGDSGGPLLYAEQIAGVTSFGDAACAVSATYVHVPAAFVSDALSSIAAMPTLRRPSPSDLCHVACTDDGQCPLGFACTSGHCALPGGAAVTVAHTCSADGQCAGGQCTALDDGCHCLEPCAPTMKPSRGCSFVP